MSDAEPGDASDPEDSWTEWRMRRREASDDEDTSSEGEERALRTYMKAIAGFDDVLDSAGGSPEDEEISYFNELEVREMEEKKVPDHYNQGHYKKKSRDSDVEANRFKPIAKRDSQSVLSRIVRGRGPVKYKPLKSSNNDVETPIGHMGLFKQPGGKHKPLKYGSDVDPATEHKDFRKLPVLNSNADSTRVYSHASTIDSRLTYKKLHHCEAMQFRGQNLSDHGQIAVDRAVHSYMVQQQSGFGNSGMACNGAGADNLTKESITPPRADAEDVNNQYGQRRSKLQTQVDSPMFLQMYAHLLEPLYYYAGIRR